jgi:hypothetical protein
MAKIHYLYQIKNNINGKIYIGIHSTTNMDDGYYGSGNLITKAIQKYGKSNFTKTILKFCSSREELVNLEREIINKDFIIREDTYNLSLGGSSLNSTWENSNKTIKNKLKNDPIWVESRSRNISLGIKNAIKNGRCSTATREFQLIRNKKSLTEESINKRKNTYAKNKHQQGQNHALYNKKAVHNELGWKWIQNNELESYLNSGWKLGKGTSRNRV